MKILFIGHNAQRTGAPMVLLNLIRWIAENRTDIHFETVLLEGGVLSEEYRRVSNVTVLSDHRSVFDRIQGRIATMFGTRLANSIHDHEILERHFDLVLGNTVLSLPMLDRFSGKGVPTVCWVHEMENVVRHFFEPDEFRRLTGRVDQLILGSNAVRRTLKEFRIATPADVVYELQPPFAGPTSDRNATRNELGIPTEAFVVIGCGLIGRRKGVDIFLDAAEALIEKYSDVYFVWVGGRQKGKDSYADGIYSRLKEIGSDRIVFTGERASVSEYFAAADVFALTSREDPFPLVCLVAAENALPIVCFAEAGGIPEFVGEEAGVIVPNGDTTALVDAIDKYYVDGDALRIDGHSARRKFEGPFSIDASAERMIEILIEVAQGST